MDGQSVTTITGGPRYHGDQSIQSARRNATLTWARLRYGRTVIVLLDQSDWISIARAEAAPQKATSEDKRLQELVAGLSARGTKFPLSLARYHETLKLRNPKHRRHVATAMQRYSKYESLMAPGPVLDLQLDELLSNRYGTPTIAMPVLGFGWTHALGVRGPIHADADRQLAIELDSIVRALAPEIAVPFEFAALSGEGIDVSHRAALEGLRSFIECRRLQFEPDERRFEELLRQYAGGDRAELRRLARGQSLSFYIDRILAVCLHRGLDAESVVDDITDPEISVVDELPSVDVLASLREQKARNPSKAWTSNDYYDVLTLQHGLPYCDIVSADKYWSDLCLRAGLAERYGVDVIAKPARLIERLEVLFNRENRRDPRSSIA